MVEQLGQGSLLFASKNARPVKGRAFGSRYHPCCLHRQATPDGCQYTRAVGNGRRPPSPSTPPHGVSGRGSGRIFGAS
ncbi:hypothetical protein ARMA_1747 [Ardenticatena maritima]|uniref:Uncharacterized protein n=1 Tax=Ardenticatena maritima TaxID=872965 RepID=A0A0M9UCV1_9CHLR|nr:hypothetical protein ARMA_1747 [Ardenticatena maritima]